MDKTPMGHMVKGKQTEQHPAAKILTWWEQEQRPVGRSNGVSHRQAIWKIQNPPNASTKTWWLLLLL